MSLSGQEKRAGDGGVLPMTADALRVARDGRALLDGVSIALEAGGTVTAVIGPNGAGKSLLIRCLAGLVVADAGDVTWAGTAPDLSRRRRIGFVLQRPVLLRRSARENIAFGLRKAGVAEDVAERRVAEELTAMGLERVADTPARLLSGGEQQRVALARALVLQPDILFIDEATTNLDPASTAVIEGRLKGLAARGVPIVVVTQDLKQARRLATAIVMMHNGRLLEHTPAASFFAAPQTVEAQRFLDGALLLDADPNPV